MCVPMFVHMTVTTWWRERWEASPLVKILAGRPDDLTLIPRPHMVENLLLKLSLALFVCAMPLVLKVVYMYRSMCARARTPTHTQILINKIVTFREFNC